MTNPPTWGRGSQEHHDWLLEVATDIERDYEASRLELAKHGAAAAQEVGHRTESVWGRVLSQWLPPSYAIGYRKYLLLESGLTARTKETDLVVYHPSYPAALRERTTILVSGVAAAFSIKRTLDRAGLEEANSAARELKMGISNRDNGLRGNIVPPVYYGLLAHAHAWRSDEQTVENTVGGILSEFEGEQISPFNLDLICIASLNCWRRQTQIISNETAKAEAAAFGRDSWARVSSGLYKNDRSMADELFPGLPAVPSLITSLIEMLAANDPSIGAFAAGLRATNPNRIESAIVGHRPLEDVLDDTVLMELDQRLDSDRDWQSRYP